MQENLIKYLTIIVGGIITNVVIDNSKETFELFGESLISLDVKMPDGTLYNVQPYSDAEGNSQGFLEIIEIGT